MKGIAPTIETMQAVMVYMSGDNNLEDYIAKGIEQQLAHTGSSADANANANANGITIYQIDTAAQKDAYWNHYQGLGLAPSRWIAFLNDYAR